MQVKLMIHHSTFCHSYMHAIVSFYINIPCLNRDQTVFIYIINLEPL